MAASSKLVAGIAAATAIAVIASAAPAAQQKGKAAVEKPPPVRNGVIAKAQLWKPTNIPTIDIKLGPQGKGAFLPKATVRCEYLEEQFNGNSPKFLCAQGPTLDD